MFTMVSCSCRSRHSYHLLQLMASRKRYTSCALLSILAAIGLLAGIALFLQDTGDMAVKRKFIQEVNALQTERNHVVVKIRLVANHALHQMDSDFIDVSEYAELFIKLVTPVKPSRSHKRLEP